MTNLTRWEPFNDMLKLSTAMDQLFNNAMVPAFGRGGSWPAINVLENEDSFIVQAVVPGIDPDHLDISASDKTLTLKGQWQQPSLPQGTTFHLREWGSGRFERTIQFSLPVNVDAVQAQYEYGILTLTLPKTDAVKPRRISVQSQTQQLEATAQPVSEEELVAA